MSESYFTRSPVSNGMGNCVGVLFQLTEYLVNMLHMVVLYMEQGYCVNFSRNMSFVWMQTCTEFVKICAR